MIFSLLLLSLIGVGVMIVFQWGVFTKEKHVHPPCEQLPQVEEVNDAIVKHERAIEKIESLSENIHVHIGRPCAKDPNRGLLLINYHSSQEREKVDQFIRKYEGFGVPVYVEKY